MYVMYALFGGLEASPVAWTSLIEGGLGINILQFWIKKFFQL